jgi:hypothetical protein
MFRVSARLLLATTLGWFGAAVMDRATATQTCQGSYTAALLQALPAKIVARIDIHDRSPSNLKLAGRFLGGGRDAGVAVGAQPNVTLHVTTSRLSVTPTQSGRGAVQDTAEFSGLEGGIQPSLPALPSTGFATSRSQSTPPLMFVRVDATVGDATRISWLASIQCQMIGSDEVSLRRIWGFSSGVHSVNEWSGDRSDAQGK